MPSANVALRSSLHSYSQMIVASLYAPDGDVDTLSVGSASFIIVPGAVLITAHLRRHFSSCNVRLLPRLSFRKARLTYCARRIHVLLVLVGFPFPPSSAQHTDILLLSAITAISLLLLPS